MKLLQIMLRGAYSFRHKTAALLIPLFFIIALQDNFAKSANRSHLYSAALSIADDTLTYKDHQIKVDSLNGSGFGYRIYKNDSLLIEQTWKPFFSVPKPFKLRSNALLSAKWQIDQLLKPADEREWLNLSKAQEIGITTNDLTID